MLQNRFAVTCKDALVEIKTTSFFMPNARRVSRREARREIKRIPRQTSLIDPFKTRREFYRAVIDRELPHHFLCRLNDFEKRSDELPEMLTSSSQRKADHKSPLKCNYSTISGLEETLGLMLAQKLIKDSSVLDGINAYANRKWNAAQPYGDAENALRTTPDELKLINDTIGLVKKYLIEEYACKVRYNKFYYAIAAFLHLKPPKNSPTPKWQVRRGLRTLRKSGENEYNLVSPVFEATLNGTLPQYCLRELKRYKNYSDALPYHEDKLTRQALLWNDPKYPDFKCRGNIIMGISLALQKPVYEGVAKDPAVILAINNLNR